MNRTQPSFSMKQTGILAPPAPQVVRATESETEESKNSTAPVVRTKQESGSAFGISIRSTRGGVEDFY